MIWALGPEFKVLVPVLLEARFGDLGPKAHAFGARVLLFGLVLRCQVGGFGDQVMKLWYFCDVLES